MNKKLNFSGGETEMRIDDFTRMPFANKEFIDNLFVDYDEMIISGCGVGYNTGTGHFTGTNGFVKLGGEILKVDAFDGYSTGTNSEWIFQKSVSYDSAGDKLFADGNIRQTWQINRAVPTSVATVSEYELSCFTTKRFVNLTNQEINTVVTRDFVYPKLTAVQESWVQVNLGVNTSFPNSTDYRNLSVKFDKYSNRVFIEGVITLDTDYDPALIFSVQTGYTPATKKIIHYLDSVGAILGFEIEQDGAFSRPFGNFPELGIIYFNTSYPLD